jgi:hypothetical protein
LVLQGRIAALGQGFGDRARIESVNKKFTLRVREAAPGAQFVQQGRQQQAAGPAGLLFQRAQQIARGALPPADPLQNELCRLWPGHFGR